MQRGKLVFHAGGDAVGSGKGIEEEVNVWKGKQPQLETTRDEEFDQYLSDMFM
jgi:hypothetical protein